MSAGAAKILVLDADQGSALAAARSLHAAGYVVFLAGTQEAPHNARSACVHRYLRYPSPMADEAAFCRWIAGTVAQHGLSLILPMTERTLLPLASHTELPEAARRATPDIDTLRQVTDKAATFAIAASHGVALPRSQHIDSVEQLEAVRGEFPFPVVLKPTSSVSSAGGRRVAHTVSYALNDEELGKRAALLLRDTSFVLQEHFQGLGVGVEVLARDGEILYAFQHRRLHEVPLSGGGSSLRVSEDVASTLRDAAARLLRAIRWTGVAMVEFKWRPDSDEYRLMEINGRFWGSLPLAVAAGADFPAMLADMLLRGKSTGFADYRRGIYCRHLARDLMWHEQVLRTPPSPLVRIPARREVLRDLTLVLSPRHYFDVQRLTDPLPGLLELAALCGSYARRAAGLAAERWFTFRQRLLWHNGTVATRMRDARSALFLCYGNINRSAAAELLLKGASESALRIGSAGFHEIAGRPVDPSMAALLQEVGLDTEQMRSQTVNEQMLRDSDIVFVMEKTHYDRAVALCPCAATKTFLLGAARPASEAPTGEIADPYNRSASAYRACFNTLRAATADLAALLNR